jgi:hypothetical protein
MTVYQGRVIEGARTVYDLDTTPHFTRPPCLEENIMMPSSQPVKEGTHLITLLQRAAQWASPCGSRLGNAAGRKAGLERPAPATARAVKGSPSTTHPDGICPLRLREGTGLRSAQ